MYTETLAKCHRVTMSLIPVIWQLTGLDSFESEYAEGRGVCLALLFAVQQRFQLCMLSS